MKTVDAVEAVTFADALRRMRDTGIPDILDKAAGFIDLLVMERDVVLIANGLLGQLVASSGWIVGNGDGTLWRVWTDGMSCWTNDRNRATRYLRREDAEAVHAEDEDAWSVQLFMAMK